MMIATALAGFLAIGWLTIALAPNAPAARFLKPWLVDWPAAKLARFERRHLIYLVVAIVSAQALMSIGMPDLGVALAWDVSAYIDLALIGMTMAAATNVKAAGRLLATQWRAFRRPRPMPRQRAKRAPVRRPPAPSANDDDHLAPILLIA